MPGKRLATAEECAERVMETLPMATRAIGMEMHRRHAPDLSLPQFRAMLVIERNAGAPLSLVAEQLGVTPSAVSRLVDGLVERGYLKRETAPEDRRRVTLTLTAPGAAMLETARRGAMRFLAERLAALTDEERRCVAQAMASLHALFTGR